MTYDMTQPAFGSRRHVLNYKYELVAESSRVVGRTGREKFKAIGTYSASFSIQFFRITNARKSRCLVLAVVSCKRDTQVQAKSTCTADFMVIAAYGPFV